MASEADRACAADLYKKVVQQSSAVISEHQEESKWQIYAEQVIFS